MSVGRAAEEVVPARPVLEASGLAVVRRARRVLDEVSFALTPGRVHAIVGPNGAGKSTLLGALTGLLAHQGEVRVRGASVSALSAAERARQIAYVPQRSSLEAPLRVDEVVALGRFAHARPWRRPPTQDEAVRRALARTDTEMFARRSFLELSVGERTRVLIARALATEAQILLLDEPTAALDVRHALELLALLRELAAEGFAIGVVLHALDEVLRFTDDATLLVAGRVYRAGPVASVIAPDPVAAAYAVDLVAGGAVGFRMRSDE